MAIIIKEFIYNGGVNIGEVPHGTSTLTLHLWGGAGGGGGDDVGDGGSGASGQYVTVTNLDISAYAAVKEITVTVGGGGEGGSTGTGAEGGVNGKSLTGYSGGKGGDAGPQNPSGSGGGGGGATVVTVFTSGSSITQTVLAIAGGGAGAGGAGAYSSGGGGSNTNNATARSPGTLGENGAPHSTAGGGAGAGGGGADGGTGGSSDTGDIGGFGGRAGSNTVPSGGSADNGSGITPGGTGVAYYESGVAVGGANAKSGGNGKAVLIFTIPSEAKFKVSGAWKTVTGIHSKISGTWKRLVGGYTKVSGEWKAIFANDVNFTVNYAFFGDDNGGTTSGTVGGDGAIPATPAAVESDPGDDAANEPRGVPLKCRTEWVSSGPTEKGYAVKTVVCDTCSCFIAGTKVRMADGTDMNIEDVIAGDLVKGKDGDDLVTITYRTLKGSRKLYSFNKSGSYFVTSEHPFWTEEGFKSIKPEKTLEREEAQVYNDLVKDKNGKPMALKVNENVKTLDGMVRIRSIESKEVNNFDLPLYSFVLKNNHSYFADGYCVHNGGGSSSNGDSKVVCTTMYQTTGLEDWRRAMKIWGIYHERVLGDRKDVQNGYHWMFKPYARMMRKNKVLKFIGAWLARHVTNYMKYRLFVRNLSESDKTDAPFKHNLKKTDKIGKVIMAISEPTLSLIGRIIKKLKMDKDTNKW